MWLGSPSSRNVGQFLGRGNGQIVSQCRMRFLSNQNLAWQFLVVAPQP